MALEAVQIKRMAHREVELAGVQHTPAKAEGQFLQHLDFLKRGVITEAEFAKANDASRGQVAALEARRDELKSWVSAQQARASAAARLPGQIRSFREDFQELESLGQHRPNSQGPQRPAAGPSSAGGGIGTGKSRSQHHHCGNSGSGRSIPPSPL